MVYPRSMFTNIWLFLLSCWFPLDFRKGEHIPLGIQRFYIIFDSSIIPLTYPLPKPSQEDFHSIASFALLSTNCKWIFMLLHIVIFVIGFYLYFGISFNFHWINKWSEINKRKVWKPQVSCFALILYKN